MRNHIRIKLEINLKYVNSGTNQNNYILIIKVLKKDKRFNVKADSRGSYSSYVYTDVLSEFVIGTNSYNFKGSIDCHDFQLPNEKYLGRKIIGSFMTDKKRKTYLKTLHNSLLTWADDWTMFKDEPKPKFRVLKNKWYIYITE